MAIEGPLCELSIHDVFQLLDLSRKTGVLYVTAAERDDEVTVLFERGRVISASLRSKPEPPDTTLSGRALERHVRSQIEAIVFEIMSWVDGFFSFETRDVHAVPIAAKVSLATESLLMEGVRRMDEWSRIADRVPHLDIVPALATPESTERSPLDLQPTEWELLATIDGKQDLRTIAMLLGRAELEVADMVHRLATNGIVTLHDPRVTSNGEGAYTSV